MTCQEPPLRAGVRTWRPAAIGPLLLAMPDASRGGWPRHLEIYSCGEQAAGPGWQGHFDQRPSTVSTAPVVRKTLLGG